MVIFYHNFLRCPRQLPSPTADPVGIRTGSAWHQLTNPESHINRYECGPTCCQNREVRTPKEEFGSGIYVVPNPTSGIPDINIGLVSWS